MENFFVKKHPEDILFGVLFYPFFQNFSTEYYREICEKWRFIMINLSKLENETFEVVWERWVEETPKILKNT